MNNDIKRLPYRLSIRIGGPKVIEARLSAFDLVEIVRRTQSAIKQIGQCLYSKNIRIKGRKKKEVEQYCEIFMVAWEKGSAIARFELAQPPIQRNLFEEIGEASLHAFINGMNKIAVGQADKEALPEGFSPGVIQTLEGLGSILEHGIEQITFFSENSQVSQEVVYNQNFRVQVRQLLAPPEQKGLDIKVGRLEMLNGHGDLTGRLWEPNGSRWTCNFKQGHIETLANAWMRNVKVTGNLIGSDKDGVIEVTYISILDEEVLDFDESQSQSFWKSIPTVELVEQQGVSPATDLDQISALWPADDDPDELLNFIIAKREISHNLNRDVEAK